MTKFVVKLGVVGSSMMLRIPAEMVQKLGYKKGEYVLLAVNGKNLNIEPVDEPDSDAKPKDWFCDSCKIIVPIRGRCKVCGKTEREKT